MKLNYDKETDSLYIHLSERPSVDSDEVADGVVLDFDENGGLVGIDVQHASQKNRHSIHSSVTFAFALFMGGLILGWIEISHPHTPDFERMNFPFKLKASFPVCLSQRG